MQRSHVVVVALAFVSSCGASRGAATTPDANTDPHEIVDCVGYVSVPNGAACELACSMSTTGAVPRGSGASCATPIDRQGVGECSSTLTWNGLRGCCKYDGAVLNAVLFYQCD